MPPLVSEVRSDPASRRDGAAMSVVHGLRRVGAITWKPWSGAGAPSACSDTIRRAPTRLPKRPRASTHGPHFVTLLVVRVIRTRAPSASRRRFTARERRKVTVASGTPLFVAGPVVLHGLVNPPAGTGRFVSLGWRPLPSW